ncbi:MAG TPA: TIGR02444 family protein, partial [Alphaproteobacteria bacterium]
ARAGVPDACLRLQARHGVDVNLLFFCLWVGYAHGETLDRAAVERLKARVRAIHEDVVRPLRAARTALKPMLAEAESELGAVLGRLRAEVKRIELDAEYVEQLMLAAERPSLPVSRATVAPRDTARANAETYLAALDVRPDATDHADLAILIAALDGIESRTKP